MQAARVAQENADGDRDQRRGAREQHRVQRDLAKIRRPARLEAQHRVAPEHDRRDDEPEQHRQRAERARERRPPTAERAPLERPEARPARLEVLAVTAADALQRDQHHDEGQQEGGDLRTAAEVVHAQPDVVETGGERADGEVVDGAVVVQRLHHRHRETHHDRRASHREGYPEEAVRAVATERAGGLEHRGRLLEEGGAGEEVDVGVEHQHQHQDRARHRADGGKAVVARELPAEERAQRRLHRSRELEQIGVDVGDDVGRHRERQQERPVEDAPAGEVVVSDVPGRADADQYRAERHPAHQHERVRDVAAEYRRDEVRPDVLLGPEGEPHDRQHRQRDEERDGEGGDRPAAVRVGRVRRAAPPPLPRAFARLGERVMAHGGQRAGGCAAVLAAVDDALAGRARAVHGGVVELSGGGPEGRRGAAGVDHPDAVGRERAHGARTRSDRPARHRSRSCRVGTGFSGRRDGHRSR